MVTLEKRVAMKEGTDETLKLGMAHLIKPVKGWLHTFEP